MMLQYEILLIYFQFLFGETRYCDRLRQVSSFVSSTRNQLLEYIENLFT